ncbi:hypothetical protein LCGC14_1913650 [marine sediment metagenome]|uniref:Uncharacterized protein n=1 Tax=marine sediment metagenome TaxID=412755 RepID=A0A0F9GG26_9ZZZZ
MTRQELHRLLKQSKDIYQLLTDLLAAKQAYHEAISKILRGTYDDD